MTESKFKEGDYVKVLEDHYRVKAGTVWRLDYYMPAEDIEEDGKVTTYGPSCGATSADGTRSGPELDEDKIERITENIPFSVYAVVEVEVYATVYASSEDEAVAQAKSDYAELLDNFSEKSGTVKSVYLTGS